MSEGEARVRELEAEIERLRSRLERNRSATRLVLSAISHDLRGPLATALTWTHLLRGTRVDEERRRRGLDAIERAVRAELSLIENLVEVARLSVLGIVPARVPLDFAAIVRAAVADAGPRAAGKPVEFEVRTTTAAEIHGDEALLRRAVDELIANAIKASPPAGRIRVEQTRAATEVRLAVADDGPGISPELLPGLFDRFRESAPGSARIAGGTGFGLTLVRRIAELHGGSAEVDPGGEGRGATFLLRLPAPTT